jgi:hypothetical protein
MSTITRKTLARLAELLEKATPGPWLLDGRTAYALASNGKQNRFWASVQSAMRTNEGEATEEECRTDAALIAELRNHAAALLDLVRRQDEELQLRRKLDGYAPEYATAEDIREAVEIGRCLNELIAARLPDDETSEEVGRG